MINASNVRIPFYAFSAHVEDNQGHCKRLFLAEKDWLIFTLQCVEVSLYFSSCGNELRMSMTQLPSSQVRKMAEAVDAINDYFYASLRKSAYNPISPTSAITVPISRRCQWCDSDVQETTANVVLSIRGVYVQNESYEPILSIDKIDPSLNADKEIEYSPGSPSSNAPSYSPTSPKRSRFAETVDWEVIAAAVSTAKNQQPAPTPTHKEQAATPTSTHEQQAAPKPTHEPTTPGSRYYWSQVDKGSEQATMLYYRCKRHKQYICPNCELHIPTWDTFKTEHAGCHSFQNRDKLSLCKTCPL